MLLTSDRPPPKMLFLDKLKTGQSACVEAINGQDAIVQRLYEMGLMEGTLIEVIGFAPMGDPIEIRLQDFRLSLEAAARLPVSKYAWQISLLPTLSHASLTIFAPLVRMAEMIALRTPLVALVGNPNTGKTTLFNALAGMKQHVGNYPGVTVETKKGKLTFSGQTFDLIDLPGTYSLAAAAPTRWWPSTSSSATARRAAARCGRCAIVDASNLERNLYLATQVLELGVPVSSP